MNTFGTFFRFTSFGESHGVALGGVIDGCPAGLAVDFDFIKSELFRRCTAQSEIATQRFETDEVTFLSGIFEGKTIGTPIGFLIKNEDAQSADYETIKNLFRPSHADFTYIAKYGTRDWRGGGRASARETAARVVAGAFAKLFLKQKMIDIQAVVSQAGSCKNPAQMSDYIRQIQVAGDSIGGTVTCTVSGLSAGIGEPIFGKLQSLLAAAMLSIPAARGFDYGIGFEGIMHKGSEQNDEFTTENDKIVTRTNHSGGIQGGISNGMPVYFRVLFKPASSIALPQQTVDIQGNAAKICIDGRHDSCVLFRAVPVVEAMAALVVADLVLQKN